MWLDNACVALALAACSLIGEKVGDTGSNTSSNRIACQFIALFKTCFAYTSLSSHSSCTCSWPTQWTMTKLWPMQAVSWVVSTVHREQRAHCLSSCSTPNPRPIAHEAVSIIWTWRHLRNWWRIAKSKLSNELERGGIYGMTYDRS